MASSDLKLLGSWASPYVIRVRIALNIKSKNYELIEENLMTKSELLLKSNPVHKKIPVLIHGENPICESLIIVQYIDEAWSDGPSILPSDPLDRATARFWGAFVDDKLFPLIRELRNSKEEEAKAAALEKIIEVVVVLEEAFVKCSKGKAFFGGENIGYVDIAFGCTLALLKAIGIMIGTNLFDENKVPNLVAWAERFCKEGVVKDVLPEVEKLLELFKMIQAREKASSN